MRRPFVAGNWKMHLDRTESVALAKAVAAGMAGHPAVEVAICPASVYLDAVVQATKGSSVAVGAQNLYQQPNGAYTGEISAAMVKNIGCKYVILGHSERRNVMGETNKDVNLRLVAALAADLVPIVCVGELLEQREAGRTMSVIQEQFEGSFAGISEDQMTQCVIAYEPVWAIGTGQVATPQEAEEVHADLRNLIQQQYNAETANAVRIQYGGSVKSDNAVDLITQTNIDGALVGGASLQASSFLAIVQAAGKLGTN